MIVKTVEIPKSVLKAENMKYDNSNSGLEASNAQQAIDEIVNGEITVDELMSWYADMEADTGIANHEIDKMYEDDIQYGDDTGLSNNEIDEMYES